MEKVVWGVFLFICLFVVVPQGGRLMCSVTTGKLYIFMNHQRKFPLLTFVQARGTKAVAMPFLLIINMQEIVPWWHSKFTTPVSNLQIFFY
jgi:hypothetical protein